MEKFSTDHVIESTSQASGGLGISQSAEHIRNYMAVEKMRLRILAGWFLRIGSFERKYRLAYHLYDASEHVSWLLSRLKEMRAGKAEASIRPQLQQMVEATLHATDDEEFLAGFYGVLTRELSRAIATDLELMDPSANANEIRILQRMGNNLQHQLGWFDQMDLPAGTPDWVDTLKRGFDAIGGIHGEGKLTSSARMVTATGFQRPSTILFNDAIRVGKLSSYQNRQQMDRREATIEQFRVFFNEFYAAALLASILFDASGNDYPCEFFADFSRHFWDEARHSEFGAIRLKELGVEPDRVNPILFEEAEGLPVLHRIAYLTRGLEAYFMPRKPKRVTEYEENQDFRSQLFADQDWSDEINHVRFGSKWLDILLEDDYREATDIIDEVKAYLSRVRGYPVVEISAPF